MEVIKVTSFYARLLASSFYFLRYSLFLSASYLRQFKNVTHWLICYGLETFFLFRHSTLFRAVQSRRVTARGTNQSHNKWVSCNQMDLILLWLLSISTCEVFATAVPLANAVKCTWNCSVTQKIAFVL